MSLSVFIEMTLSAILTVWSPGPNNILLLSNASKYGVCGNLRFMAGIWSGSLTLMCLSGLFCSTLGSIIPGIQPVMKYLALLISCIWPGRPGAGFLRRTRSRRRCLPGNLDFSFR